MQYSLEFNGTEIVAPRSYNRKLFGRVIFGNGIHKALPVVPPVGDLGDGFILKENPDPTPQIPTFEEVKQNLVNKIFGTAYAITDSAASQYSPTEKSDWYEMKEKGKKNDAAFFEQFVQGCTKTTALEYMAKVKIMTLQLENLKASVISARNRHLEEIEGYTTVEECNSHDTDKYWPEGV